MRYIAALVVLLPQLALAQRTSDSAGVRIVESTRSVLPAARAWRVDPRPMLAIGCGATDLTGCSRGDSLYEFNLIMGVARLSDGRIAVAVQGSDHIRFFDTRGKYLASAGRDGDGPGEFRQILGMTQTRGDTLAVTDLGEVEYFTGDGKHIRRGASRALGDFSFVFPSGFFDDGSYVGLDRNTDVVLPAGRRLLERPLVHVSADGRQVDTLGRRPEAEQVFDGRSRWGRRFVFGPVGLLAAGGDRFYFGYPSRWEVGAYDRSGRLQLLMRRTVSSRPVTDADRDAYRAHLRRFIQSDPYHPTTPERAQQAIENLMFAEQLPTFGDLLVDRTGHLWVKAFDIRDEMQNPGPASVNTIAVPTQWDVFDREGRWLCTVQLPARFTPLEIGADYVAGLARDEDDIEYVHLYRLSKPRE